MLTTSACELIDQLTYKPGWGIRAECFDARHEGCIKVHFEYPARASEREYAPEFPKEIVGRAAFVLRVRDLDQIALYRALLVECIFPIEQHEAREFLRVKPTEWAPFHPHRHDGQTTWGDVQGDLFFGVA